jgi:ABC-2 type transport system permease protein
LILRSIHHVNYLRLIVAFFWVGIMSEVAYRANFFFQFIQSILSLGVALSGIAVIFSYTDTLGGWNSEEILALVGVYLLVGGIIGLMIQPGIEEFIGSVRDGGLDFILVKPEDSQLLVTIQKINIWSLIDIVFGMGVLITALALLGESRCRDSNAIYLDVSCRASSFQLFLALATFRSGLCSENILTIFQSMYRLAAGRLVYIQAGCAGLTYHSSLCTTVLFKLLLAVLLELF